MDKTLVGILMGSESDAEVMLKAKEILDELGINSEVRILSAHRTPTELHEYIENASESGGKIFIAGAGMSAHLAGVTASLTTIPVLGVPTESKLKGLDSLLSTVQMPSGIPVGTVAIGKAGAINSALLAVSILSTRYKNIHKKLKLFRNKFEKKVPKRPF